MKNQSERLIEKLSETLFFCFLLPKYDLQLKTFAVSVAADLNFKWRELIKIMPSLFASRKKISPFSDSRLKVRQIRWTSLQE